MTITYRFYYDVKVKKDGDIKETQTYIDSFGQTIDDAEPREQDIKDMYEEEYISHKLKGFQYLFSRDDY